MNSIFSVITGLSMHAYEIAAFLCLIRLVGEMMFRGFEGKRPL